VIILQGFLDSLELEGRRRGVAMEGLGVSYIYDITLHYITLHYITLHYITLHYITLHYITLQLGNKYQRLHIVGGMGSNGEAIP
jgi:hypothetical protein